ncbi:glycosyltransferase family 4 protein [Microlunatus aurantiacus]|uniref:Glycosyltransferase family 4 protein n=1 Tax=Microlunatus aurantiacus TaxID=446786 RepID=A0ABP7DRB7_9ACTN
MAGGASKRPDHVLIIVQNLPVPLDRRVWLECLALKAAGYDVSVICPKGPGDGDYQVLEDVHIYKYKPAPEARGLPGFVIEFVYSWLRTAVLSSTVWRRQPFTIMQACNPPDTYWALGLLWRLRGVTFVFDHHDLNPELFISRFGEPTSGLKKVEYAGLRWLERMTFRTAKRVISTNESYKAVAVRRGGRAPHEVTVVRSGPDTRQMRPIYPSSAPGGDRVYTLAYLGIMGPQDGVDVVLDVMEELVHRRGRRDVRAVLLGFGDCYEDLRAQCTKLGLDAYVTFTGRADRAMIAEHLSVSDIGLCPDLKTPLNDVSTMNKTMEYMSYALPSVSFDLVETRVSGGNWVLYVPSGNVAAFTDAVETLLDDPDLRVMMARGARERVSSELDWRPQAKAYLGVFAELTGRAPYELSDGSAVAATADPQGRTYVPLDDEVEFERFIRERTAR